MKHKLSSNLLWVDCTAGALVGTLVLALHGWLSEWYGLPEHVLIFTGIANVVYAAYSFSLARRERRSTNMIGLLIVANLSWPPVCMYLASQYWSVATIYGLGHLIFEALFVGGLALLEWRYRDQLIR